jgi:hypothetical protein
MSDYDLINGEIINVTITVDEETVTGIINTAARGPAGADGGGTNSITSATTSDGTANLSLSNVTTATATVTGTLTADHIHGNLAGNVYGHVRAGETLAKGDPVYVSGSHGSGSTLIPIVSKADASNAAKMPAVGIMDAAVANNATGHMVIVGTITELNTAGYSVNAELYVASGGGMTATPPTARAQPVARVERANANNGAVIVKVNGLSASDATASTLVRRDSSGGAVFGAGPLEAFSLVVTGGTTFGDDSLLQFDATEYYYGTGAASAHRIALGGVGDSSTGTALFGAATAAAARTTLMGEILKYAPNAAATRTNPATQADDDVLTGINLTAGIWEFSFYFSFSVGSGGVIPNLIFGTPSSLDLTNLCDVGYYYHLNQGIASIRLNTGTGVIAMLTRNNTTNVQYTGSFILNITGNTSFAMTYARNTDVPGSNITRRAGAFLRARKIN